jgi:Cd2+/Zn2+-exporting ATPase
MEHQEEKTNWLNIGAAAVMLVAGMIMSHIHVAWFQEYEPLWYCIALVTVGFDVMKEAFENARHGDVFSEFTLMSVASFGALCIGEGPEAVSVMLFYCIGEAFQDAALNKARHNIQSLIAFFPDKARVVMGDEIEEKRPSEVAVGDVIEIKAGERVPLDGVLISADAAFDTAALTGESVPRMIDNGSQVLAGMISSDSTVRLRVNKTEKESAVMRIMTMVSDATERKAPTELFIRKFSHVYTPTVIVLAVLTVLLPFIYSLLNPQFSYAFDEWLYRGLIFLVISCPCALVISIPLGYFGGIGAASKRGILFKGSNFVDAITKVDTVVFDKTGTLTKGVFSVQRVVGLSQNDINVVSSIEQNSTHPIAKAIIKTYPSQTSDAAISDVKNISGYGLSARCGDDEWLAGTLRLLEINNIEYPEELKSIPETIVACAKNGAFIGYFLLSDTLKDDSKDAIRTLRRADINRVEILSGDKQTLVNKVSEELKVDNGYGDLLPGGKVEHIETLKSDGHKVAFVGDGINDAPVLALSDVGIAMGGLGSDMAIETADIVIQTDQPSKVAEAIRIGKRTHTIVKQNIVFAIGIKVLVMVLGVLGVANLWEAVFADVGVALLAVLNSTRALLTDK